jgi:hypothetical protein
LPPKVWVPGGKRDQVFWFDGSLVQCSPATLYPQLPIFFAMPAALLAILFTIFLKNI